MKMKKEGKVSSPFAQKRMEAFGQERTDHLFRNIENLEYAIDQIFKKLTPEINRGDFTLIIGDDASGRIPTFIIAHALKTIYKKKKLQPPIVRFIAGSTRLSESERKRKLEKVATQIGRIKETVIKAHGTIGKALVVTDIVETGASLRVLLDALSQNHMDAQPVSLGESTVNNAHKEELTEEQIRRLIVGDSDNRLFIYGKRQMSGVQKNPNDLFATPADGLDRNMPAAARAVAMQVAEKVVTEFLKKHP